MERKQLVAAVVVAILAGVIAGQLYRMRRRAAAMALPPPPAGLVQPAWELSRAIDECAGYLARYDDPQGRFTYRLAPDGRPIAPKKYNVLRHAGAIYALADYRVHGRDGATLEGATRASERAEAYLLGRYVRPLRADATLLGVWSDPQEEGGNKPSAKLGGAGLAMIGLLGQYRAADGGSSKELETAQGLARFVQLMQKPEGDYVSKYTDDEGKVGDFESLYYPGEATLGLTMLYEADHDPRWLDTALKGVARLVSSRRGSTNIPPDHWLMIAIDRLVPFYEKATVPPSVTKDEIIDHGVALGRSMLVGQRAVFGTRSAIDGAFTQDGRTTPSATRLEGLLAMEHLLAGDPGRTAARKELRAGIERGIAFLRRAQITDGPARGGMPGALGGTRANDAGTDDSDEERPDEVRIDFVQHAMSAMMRYVVMCRADRSGCEE